MSNTSSRPRSAAGGTGAAKSLVILPRLVRIFE
jgi:hypothetical protein